MSRGLIPHGEALQFILRTTGWWGGWMPVRLGSEKHLRSAIWKQGSATGFRGDLAGIVRHLEEDNDDEVLLYLPVREPWEETVGVVSVLWARVEGPEQLERARRFRPLPSVVIQEGGRSSRLLFWALDRPAKWLEAVPQNKRIAYKLGAVQKWAEPERLGFHAPGTFVRAGRSKPAPVTCARLTDDVFELGVFSGHRGLKDPPPPPDWLLEGRGTG